MTIRSIIFAGGVFNLGVAAFHLTFWRLFDWKRDLASLSFINRQVMQVFNLCLIFIFLMFAYISLFHTEALMSSPLGHALLAMMSLFWLLRALEQVVFFGLRDKWSLMLFLSILAGGALYGYSFIVARGI